MGEFTEDFSNPNEGLSVKKMSKCGLRKSGGIYISSKSRDLPSGYLLQFAMVGKWPIEIDDFPSERNLHL